MPTVGHPSALSPRLPAIELTLPGDWAADAGGDALFRATRAGATTSADHDATGDGTTPGITAYVHTSREATTDDLVDDLAIEAEQHDEGEADPTFEVELGDRIWTGLNVSWIEDGEPVYVIHLITPVDAGEVTQFVRLTGRIAGADSEQDYDEVQGILETVRVTSDDQGSGE